MSLAIVQQKRGGGLSACEATFDSTPANGNLIVVLLDWQNTSPFSRVISAVTDSGGNTFHPLTLVTNIAGEWRTQIWYAYNVIGVSNHTVEATVTGSGGAWATIDIIEVGGVVGTGDPIDDECGDSAGSLSGPAYDFSAGTLTPSASGGFMVTVNEFTTATFLDGYPPDSAESPLTPISYTAYRWAVLTTAAAYEVGWSFSGNSAPTCSAALFKADTTQWVDVPEFEEQNVDFGLFPGGTARVICGLWSDESGVTMKARLYDVTNGVSLAESPEVTSQVVADATFGVTATGTRRVKLQLTADVPNTDLFCAPGARVSA